MSKRKFVANFDFEKSTIKPCIIFKETDRIFYYRTEEDVKKYKKAASEEPIEDIVTILLFEIGGWHKCHKGDMGDGGFPVKSKIFDTEEEAKLFISTKIKERITELKKYLASL